MHSSNEYLLFLPHNHHSSSASSATSSAMIVLVLYGLSRFSGRTEERIWYHSEMANLRSSHTLAPVLLRCSFYPCPLFACYMLGTCSVIYWTYTGQILDIYWTWIGATPLLHPCYIGTTYWLYWRCSFDAPRVFRWSPPWEKPLL